MKLISLNDWRDRYFLGEERPEIRDLQAACRDGKLPAEKVCKRWYIRVRSDDDLTPVQRTGSTGNPAADALVARVPL